MKFKFTRERGILAGLLAAAACGLLVDHLVSAIEPSGSEEYAISSPSGNKSARAAVVTPERSLSEHLIQLAGPTPASSDDIRNVFALGNASRANAGGPGTSNGWANRTLNGVLFGPEGKGVAIIDGRMVPVGSRFAGKRLVRLTQTVAVFSDGVSEITLHLSEKRSAPN